MKCGRANMKTIKNLIGKICTFPNAIKAYMKARKCKRLRPKCWSLNRTGRQPSKSNRRHTKREYTPGKYRIFKVWEPKERIIMALPFFDRVIQHMIVNIIEPIFEKRFIFHSYACRKGKARTKQATPFQNGFMNWKWYREENLCNKGRYTPLFPERSARRIKERDPAVYFR